MKTLLAGLALAALLAATPGYAFSKCKARDGSITFTDKNCHGLGHTMQLRLRNASSYSNQEVTAANASYAAEMAAARERREADAAVAQRQSDRLIADAKDASIKRDAEQAKLNITPLPPLAMDHGRYSVSNKR